MPDPILMAALARLAGAAPADGTRTRATSPRKTAPRRATPAEIREATLPTASIGPRTESGDRFQRTMQRAAERAAGGATLQEAAINLLSMGAPGLFARRQVPGTPTPIRLQNPNEFPNGNPEVFQVTERLRRGIGVDGTGMPRVKQVDAERAREMAGVYDRLPVNDPAAKSAYDALNREVAQQLKAIRDAGYAIEFVDHDPYKNSAEMMADVRNNRRLAVLKTNEGSDHPYMTREQNDAFRAVHDFFAHAGEGHQFGPVGEENAYRVHASTLSPEAQRALASETRGQNSWVNFGPNAHLPAKDRPFAQQKAALFPEEYTGDYHEMPGAKKGRVPLDSALRTLAGVLPFEHYSQQPHLAELDPSFMGTGRPGEERKYPGRPKANHVYDMREHGRQEDQFRGDYRYTGELPADRIYHANADPLGLVSKSRNMYGVFDPDAFERNIKDAGFLGYKVEERYPHIVKVFDKVPVQPADPVEVRGRIFGRRPLGGALPDQHDLPRYLGPRISDAQRQEVFERALAAMASPQWQQYRAQGEKLLGNRFWYDTRGTQQDALDALGDRDAASKAHNDLTNMMAASTAVSEPSNNLKRASWWRALYDQGLLDPASLRNNELFPAPEGFGHMAQRKTHQKAVAEVAERGGLDALANPKPASFGGRGQHGTGNLGMNWQPATIDTRMSQILKEIDPRLTPFFDGDAPKNWAYGPVERAMQETARRAAQRGDLTLLSGTSPTATEQERVWVGYKPEQGASTFRDVLDALRSESANLWGVNQTQANELLWRGQPLLLPLGAPLRGAGKR